MSDKYSELIDLIHDIPIREIVEKHIQLKQAGINFIAKCPFPGHDEKTASFYVNPNKNRCRCYGCGRGGDAITFVQLVKGYAKPGDAIKDIAESYNLPLPDKKERTPEDEQKFKQREQLKVIYEAACEYFKSQLTDEKNKALSDYLRGRASADIIEKFEIGIAPDGWTGLYDHLRGKGFKTDALIDSRLVTEKNGKVFDFFRNRIMFPITDRTGAVIAFTGRILPGVGDDQPKYINSHETPIFSKSRALFGLSAARQAIAQKNGAYLVEGNFDVTRMVQIGVENTVAPCGTALTEDQLAEIRRYTNNLVLIFDGDSAGEKAMDRAGIMAVNAGMNCNVIMMGASGEKVDPDSFFTDHKKFKEYKDTYITDFILWKARKLEATIGNYPDRKAQAMADLTALVLKYESPSRREMYLDELAKVIPTRKLWTKEIATLTKEPERKDHILHIPEGITMADVTRWGFYVDNNCYWFTRKDSVIRGSNFIMKPLFHIQSTINAKRLYEIINEHGHSEVIELLQKDLVSLQAFKLRVESLGNFLWEAGDPELNRLKRYLYEKTDTCFEVVQLGWQKHGFFAWANGIYNEKFTPTDKHGIVEHEGKKFYLPALSDIYEKDDTLFMNERRFIHSEKGRISMYDYCSKLIDVFGPNAKIAISFYLATLYRDIIVRRYNFFPILNLFGPKGAGKTELAVSIMAFFGRQAKGPNINNTSKAALADHVAQVCNACVHIDEYKNSIDFEKIEFLKGLWDGTGRTRMNMDKDKKKETTSVDCGIILSGQEIPNSDIALFSRVIYLTFFKVEYSDGEKQAFDELKDIEKKMLTHLTNENLQFRDLILENFVNAYDETFRMLNEKLNGKTIEDRIFKNWAVVLSVFVCINTKINVPFTVEELILQAADQIIIQEAETKSGNDVSGFWSVVSTMITEGKVRENIHYKVWPDKEVKYWKRPTSGEQSNKFESEDSRRWLAIHFNALISLYHENAKNYGVKPNSSIRGYLENHKACIGYTKNQRLGDRDKPFNGFCLLFDYESLGIEIPGYNLDNEESEKLPF